MFKLLKANYMQATQNIYMRTVGFVCCAYFTEIDSLCQALYGMRLCVHT
jgi:hypothetical protein